MLDSLREIEGDIRYFLCDIENETEEEFDVSTEKLCRETTKRFLDAFKKDFKINNGRRASISISQSNTKRKSLSESNNNNNNNVGGGLLVAQTSDKFIQHGYSNTTGSEIMWQVRAEQKKRTLKTKWKGRHKSLLNVQAELGKLATKRHSQYSSMRPKVEGLFCFSVILK